MTTFAQIINGIVVSRIEADEEFIATLEGEWVRDADFAMVLGHGWDGTKSIPPPADPISASDVNAERDRRLALPIEFGGEQYQATDGTIQDDFGLAVAGLQTSFSRIALDNHIVVLSAEQMIELGRAVTERRSTLALAARRLKDKTPTPSDYRNDKHWR
ncbi:hypothetical protein [Kaistia nematophila]|uniref:DUF4376 domain-containing protein n=1 Tax=Kaistia nematophila TaxID=2994654 RepID=A0A9X3E4K4_9HYPH|nr:hypothetical protein [Kaistia nematophila]MCX5569593.1 hypothetical protein [Kaistia nematophila]